MNKMQLYTFLLLTVMGTLVFSTKVSAQVQSGSPKMMVYYRAWRDKEMKGVNTSLTDDGRYSLWY